MNRQLHHAQMFTNVKQEKKQSILSFETHLSSLESQLTSYTKAQRVTHLFIKLRSKLRATLTNYQNLSTIKKDLLALTCRLKNNMKKFVDVSTIDISRLFDSKSS